MKKSKIIENLFFKKRYIVLYKKDIDGYSLNVNNIDLNTIDVSRLDKAFKNYMERRKNNTTWRAYGYFIEDTLVGYGFIHIPESVEWNDALPTLPNEARIGSLYVNPEYRGRRIVNEICLALIKNTQRDKVWAVIESSNKSSLKAALRIGNIWKTNFLIKIFGRNIISITTKPLKIYFLIKNRRAIR